jgi:O-antigen ligase
MDCKGNNDTRTTRLSSLMGGSAFLIGLVAMVLLLLGNWKALAVLVAIVSFPLLLLVTWKWPVVILFVALAANFSNFPVVFLPVGYWLFYLVAIVHIVKRFHVLKNWRSLIADPLVVIFCVLVLLGMATVPRWTNIGEGIKGFLQLAVTPLIAYIIFRWDVLQRDVREGVVFTIVPLLLFFIVAQSFAALLWGGAIARGVSLSRNLLGFHSFDIGWARSNYLAGILVFLVALTLAPRGSIHQRGYKTVIRWVTIVIACVLIVITLSRGAMVALAVVGCAFLLLSGKKQQMIVMSLVGGGALLLLLAGSGIIDKLVFRLQHIRTDYSTLSRIGMILDSIRIIKNNPVIGRGPLQIVYKGFYEGLTDPHNVFLRYGAEFGGISILFIVFLLSYPLVRLYRSMKDGPRERAMALLFIPCLIGAIVHAQMEVTITALRYGLLFWIIYSAAIVANAPNAVKDK